MVKTAAELPAHPRSGVNADQRARQFTCKVGFHFNPNAERVRETQYLGADADEATVRHIQLQREWDALVAVWAELSQIIRPGLPAHLRQADLTRPVWIKQEWGEAAAEAYRNAKDEYVEKLLGAVIRKAATHVQQIDEAKTYLARLKPGPNAALPPALIADPAVQGLPQPVLTGNFVDLLPPDLRARVLQALQPSANEVLGLDADARQLTIRQAADEFLDQEKNRVGNKLRGIAANTYMHTHRMVNDALRFLDENADLRALNHQRLMQFVIDAGSKAKSQRTAYDWVRAGLKPVIEWAHKRSDVQYRMPDTVEDIFRLRKPHTENKMVYNADTVEALKAIRKAAETMRAESWVFVLLALNTGAYAADIASWTYDNLKIGKDGKVHLEWKRVKELHHHPASNRHELWPETWDRMQKFMAPDNPVENPERRLFLSSRDGRPMWIAELGKPRVDAIGMRYKRGMAKAYLEPEEGKRVPVALPFKQLRKIGINAINEFSGGSLEVVRVYAGHAVPGVTAAYLVNRFDDVATALDKWRERLLADGVLTTSDHVPAGCPAPANTKVSEKKPAPTKHKSKRQAMRAFGLTLPRT